LSKEDEGSLDDFSQDSYLESILIGPDVDGKHPRAVHLQMLKEILEQMVHRIPFGKHFL
jgi:hypothetical protein